MFEYDFWKSPMAFSAMTEARSPDLMAVRLPSPVARMGTASPPKRRKTFPRSTRRRPAWTKTPEWPQFWKVLPATTLSMSVSPLPR